jgi:hypothetical protein
MFHAATLSSDRAPASGAGDRLIAVALQYVAGGTRPCDCAFRGSRKSGSQTDDTSARRQEHAPMNSTEIRVQLARLQLERIDACEIGLAENNTYMADLEEEILECRIQLAIAAITEAALARAEKCGRLLG